MKRYICLLLSSVLLLSCSTYKQATYEQQIKVKPTNTRAILTQGDLKIDTKRQSVQWSEDDHGYIVDLYHLVNRFMYPRPEILDGEATIAYRNKHWINYLNHALADVGINIQTVIASVPGHLMVFRGSEPINRKKQVNCLISPNANDGQTYVYSEHDIYTSPNMIEREIYEEPEKNRIIIIDHLRDKNEHGTLKIVYVMQDITSKGNASYLSHIDHRRLFKSRAVTYQYIQRVLTPISCSLQNYCRYEDFVPSGKNETFSRNFLR